MRSRERGFTLVEVLIAATILFIVIAAAADAYRSALLSSLRAESLVRLVTPLPLITSTVREALRADPRERRDGHGELLGVRYRWEAVTAKYGSPARRFDPDLTEFHDYPPRFRLYDVRLVLRAGERERTYLYQEFAWERMKR